MNIQESECIICVETINKSTRKLIKCEYCDFAACRTCCQRFVLSEVEPHCMNNSCGRTWSRKFIQNAFTNNFVKSELKKHREDVLFDREKSLMPATQPLVEKEIEIEQLKKSIGHIDIEMRQLAIKRRDLCDRMNRVVYSTTYKITEKAENDFVRECPDANCRGYLSTRWKCGICSVWVCKDCHTIKGDTEDAAHECNPDTLASRKLIEAETRPCPKCRASIYRIHGCDQMFCTKCNTAFDWRSGRILHGRNIHNPHYFEWLHSQGNQVQGNVANLDNLCMRQVTTGTMIELRNLFQAKRLAPATISYGIRVSNRVLNDYENYVMDRCRHLIQMGDMMVHRNRPNITEINEEFRVEFMRNKITLEYFKKRVQENEKKHMKELEIFNLFEMAYHSLSDIFLRYIQALAKIDVVQLVGKNVKEYEDEIAYPCELDKILNEIPVLLKYINACFEEISEVYHSTVKYVIRHNLDYEKEKR